MQNLPFARSLTLFLSGAVRYSVRFSLCYLQRHRTETSWLLGELTAHVCNWKISSQAREDPRAAKQVTWRDKLPTAVCTTYMQTGNHHIFPRYSTVHVRHHMDISRHVTVWLCISGLPPGHLPAPGMAWRPAPVRLRAGLRAGWGATGQPAPRHRPTLDPRHLLPERQGGLRHITSTADTNYRVRVEVNDCSSLLLKRLVLHLILC